MKKIFFILAFLTVFGTAIGIEPNQRWIPYYIPEGEKIPHPDNGTWYLLSLGIYSKDGETLCEKGECPTGYYFDHYTRECEQACPN